ncbi:hypothetical protein DW032_18845 [Bacillus licheniformis]|nr:hypothetical protein DW032_18845 [Bacillus licheniformis]
MSGIEGTIPKRAGETETIIGVRMRCIDTKLGDVIDRDILGWLRRTAIGQEVKRGGATRLPYTMWG